MGYSFGMFGLDMIYLNKIQLRYDDDHIVYGTSFAKLFVNPITPALEAE